MTCSLCVGSHLNNRLKEDWWGGSPFSASSSVLPSALINSCLSTDNKPKRCGYWFNWGLMIVVMCESIVDEGVILSFSWRSTMSVSKPGSYHSHLHKQRGWLALKRPVRCNQRGSTGKVRINTEFPLNLAKTLSKIFYHNMHTNGHFTTSHISVALLNRRKNQPRYNKFVINR